MAKKKTKKKKAARKSAKKKSRRKATRGSSRKRASKKKSSKKKRSSKKKASRRGASRKRATKKKASRKKAGKKKSSKRKKSKKSGRGNTDGWGGSRAGAGRPPSDDSSVSHMSRPDVRASDHLIVTMWLKPDYKKVSSAVIAKVMEAAAVLSDRLGFTVQDTSVGKVGPGGKYLLYVLCRAPDTSVLSRGMQGYTIRVARALNRRTGLSGSAFADRYEVATYPGSATRTRALAKAKSGSERARSN